MTDPDTLNALADAALTRSPSSAEARLIAQALRQYAKVQRILDENSHIRYEIEGLLDEALSDE